MECEKTEREIFDLCCKLLKTSKQHLESKLSQLLENIEQLSFRNKEMEAKLQEK
jgi:hypothetical protein